MKKFTKDNSGKPEKPEQGGSFPSVEKEVVHAKRRVRRVRSTHFIRKIGYVKPIFLFNKSIVKSDEWKTILSIIDNKTIVAKISTDERIGVVAFVRNKVLITKYIIDHLLSDLPSDINIHSILIGDKTCAICENAFDGCQSISNIFYHGNKKQWRKIKIHVNNKAIRESSIYYYSSKYPYKKAKKGKYWYYDENGNIAIWVKID